MRAESSYPVELRKVFEKMSDVLIIGAGINGLLLSRELADAGAEVRLLDAGEVGREASWAGGGIVSPLYPWRYSEPVTALVTWAQKFYPNLVEDLEAETGIDAQYQRDGLLMLDAADRDQALAWAARHGQEMSVLTTAGCYQQEENLRPGFDEGLWMPGVGHVRNPRLCRALKESLALNSRVQLSENLPVTEIQTQSGRVTAVLAGERGNQQTFHPDTVVLCAGAWSRGLLPEFEADCEIQVEPVKGQMLLYKFDGPPVKSILLHNGRYLIPRSDGHLLVGSTLEYSGFDKSLTEEARSSLSDSAAEILPVLAEMEPVAQWSGLRPGTKDGIPYIGQVPPWENLFINAGQFRNGLVLAPASVRLLADLLLAREPLVDPRPYQPLARNTAA